MRDKEVDDVRAGDQQQERRRTKEYDECRSYIANQSFVKRHQLGVHHSGCVAVLLLELARERTEVARHRA